MNRRKFLGTAGITTVGLAGGAYLMSDKKNFIRGDITDGSNSRLSFRSDEKEILYLASLAPSGHNTQPWFVKYIEPYHWIICNDNSKWLPAVDPSQRETILSIGAFLQNLEFAANNAGYLCQFDLLALTNQDEDVMEVRFKKDSSVPNYDVDRLIKRRTVRSGYQVDEIDKSDFAYLIGKESDFFRLIPRSSREYSWLTEQTIEANRVQAFRDAAQDELSKWIRFSSKDAQKNCDGLTTAGMELDGVVGWVLRNFYQPKNVLSKSFRQQGIDKIRTQVSQSGGWLLISSKDSAVSTLLETGKRFQRIFLKVREKNIAFHPMTQILEETKTRKQVNQSLSIVDEIQFILRLGYLKKYPDPVTLRRPVNWFVREQVS